MTRENGNGMKKIVILIVLVAAMAAKADYWMTFCKTPGGQQYSQVGYVKPDADGFVTIKSGPVTVVVYKTQVWHVKMPGEAPGEGRESFRERNDGVYSSQSCRWR